MIQALPLILSGLKAGGGLLSSINNKTGLNTQQDNSIKEITKDVIDPLQKVTDDSNKRSEEINENIKEDLKIDPSGLPAGYLEAILKMAGTK